MTTTLSSQTFEEACHSFLKAIMGCEFLGIDGGYVFYKRDGEKPSVMGEEVLAKEMIEKGYWG